MILRLSIVFVLSVATAGISSCSSLEGQNHANKSSGLSISNSETGSAVRNTTSIDQVIGCWSDGTGSVLGISHDAIFLSHNQFKAIAFKIERNYIEGSTSISIRLLDRPQFFFFQEFLLIERVITEEGEEALRIADVQDVADLIDISPGRRSRWMRDDCRKWGELSDIK